MNIILITFSILVIIAIFFNRQLKNIINNLNKKQISNTTALRKQRSIDSWMKMTREERHLDDLEQKKISAERRRALLSEIRNEYKDIKKRKRK